MMATDGDSETGAHMKVASGSLLPRRCSRLSVVSVSAVASQGTSGCPQRVKLPFLEAVEPRFLEYLHTGGIFPHDIHSRCIIPEQQLGRMVWAAQGPLTAPRA